MTTILLEPVEGDPAPLAASDLGRSPRQIAWRRFRRDRVGVVSGLVVLFFIAVAALAPVIAALYGKNPDTTYGLDNPGLLNQYSFPIGARGGMSSEYWLGLEPGLGRDVFMQLVYGARTSLFIAFSVALITSVFGVLFGIVTGYLGGRIDAVGGWILDLMLAFPGLLMLIALSLVVNDVMVGDEEEASTILRFATVIVLFSIFGWVFQARLIRGQVLSLREREFVDAARMSGAGTWRIVRRELLPNLWSPILVTFSIAVPSIITGEAALSFLGVGIVEPIPDWGRMVNHGSQVYLADPAYMLIPGGALLVMVLAFNLLGDAVRDALDSKGLR
ncbi:ABC transporter permease [Sporichthya sp.]|uniref:ABC transporter permease n=1 Tax=Sporichthya sp. TaxID=65475 RepID=UPI0017E15160|nr:ABC transporter permease [Sporichthya sp.]MBA3743406.1 ABC transporter permease [Sporichthya sp.]